MFIYISNYPVTFLPAWSIIPLEMPAGIEMFHSILRWWSDQLNTLLSSNPNVVFPGMVSSITNDSLYLAITATITVATVATVTAIILLNLF